MRTLVHVLVFVAFALIGMSARSLEKPADGRHLNTSFDFEDQLVQGKYQYPDEATTTVENEKMLKDLLEVRKDFKDRMKFESLRD